jgi:hypothetical protein
VILPVRLALYVTLPVMAVAPSRSLGFEAVRLLALVVIGMAGMPEERPGVARLVVSGITLAVLSVVKFTFCALFAWVLLVLFVAWGLDGRWRTGTLVLGGGAAAFLGTWRLAGQRLSSLPVYFDRAARIASGYSSAMALPATGGDLLAGLLLLLCLAALLFGYWRISGEGRPRTAGVCLLAGGIFLAWKEGFARADQHVVVFFTFAFLVAALMPGLLRVPAAAQRSLLPLTAATLAVSVGSLALLHPEHLAAAAGGLLPRLADTLTAVAAPVTFRSSVEGLLGRMRRSADLPRIRATVGNAPIGVLYYDQPVAILNGLNYRPHPVFQAYSAYSPELQRINAAAFDRDRAPDFVLWRYATIDGRFPTLDDGEIVLKILAGYAPIVRERGFTLWKRDPGPGDGYALLDPVATSAAMGQWVRVADRPTWLVLDVRESWPGALVKFLYHAPLLFIEVQLENGQAMRFRLPPGNASAGFLVNPLLLSDDDLVRPFVDRSGQRRLAAFRLASDDPWAYGTSIRVVSRRIEGLPAVQLRARG